jgi:DNA polymerase-1
MNEFFQKQKINLCNCSARKNAIYQDSYKEIYRNTPTGSVDILILMEFKELPDKFNIFKKLCDRILNKYSFAIVSSLGCTPKGFSSSDTVSTYVKCKGIHIKKIIQQLSPKVIVTTGKSIYTITENKYLKFNHFFINVNDSLQDFQIKDSWFYTPEFDCKVFPIPPLYQWIGNDIKDVYEYQFSIQQFKRAINSITEKRRKISSLKFIHVENPNQFLTDLINNKDLKKLAVDIETTGLNWIKDIIHSIQFSYDGKTGYFCLFKDIDINLLIKLFERKDIIYIYQNPQFDIKFLKRANVCNARCDFDVMTASHILNENNPNGLKPLTWMYTTYGGYENKLMRYMSENRISDFTKLPKNLLLEYACTDPIVTFQLQEYFEKRVELEDSFVKKNYYEYVIPAIDMIIDVEMRGVQVDLNYMKEYSDNLKNKTIEIEKEIYEIAGKKFNINSGKQLSEVFRSLPDFVPLTDNKGKDLLTKNGDLILNKNTLERYAEEKDFKFAKRIVEYNHIMKEISQLGMQENENQEKNYLPFFDNEDDAENEEVGFMASIYEKRLYGGYKLYGTETGRMSGGGGLDSSINYQNMPTATEFRKIFLPREGYVIGKVDYDAMEVVITSQIAGSGILEELILSGKDAHSYLAVELAKLLNWETTYEEVYQKAKIEKDEKFNDLRDDAKVLAFQNIYGATKFGIANKFGIDLDLAEQFIQTYRKTFPEVAKYIDSSREHAQKYGWVRTLLGRKRRLPQLTYIGKDSWKNRDSSFDINNLMNSAINAPVQGTSGQTTLLAMTNINKEFKSQMKSQIIINVHDEICFEIFVPEINEVEKIVKEWTEFKYYENNNNCKVRLTASLDYGEIWKSGHSTNYWSKHIDEWNQCLENIKERNRKLGEF